MKQLNHEKLIKLYAVCTHEEPIYIITELMKYGILLGYLQKGEGQNLQVPELVDIAVQVASGMAYMETHHYIHCDLAARSIMIGEGNAVKISNLGLAQLVDNDEHTTGKDDNIPIPVKWTAPECIQHNHFSIKSDVWSFGILLFELVTHGCTPYPGMRNKEILTKLKQGYRMPRPNKCPEMLYKIMLDCWKAEPNKRPTFEDLKSRLADQIYEDVS